MTKSNPPKPHAPLPWSRTFRIPLFFLLCGGLFAAAKANAAEAPEVPDGFPRFGVPGRESEMRSLRLLHWIHYGGEFGGRRARPLSTLWDEWMSGPSMWPAFPDRMQPNREEWKEKLSSRRIDDEGYVSSHMGGGLAHSGGWPFPHWWQGRGGVGGWHFSYVGAGDWPGRAEEPDTPAGWDLTSARDEGVENDAWNLSLTGAHASITPPAISFGHRLSIHPAPPEGEDAPVQETLDTFQSPFLQLRWRGKGLGNAQPFVEWRRAEDDDFSPERRFYFAPVESEEIVRTEIPVYKHPLWEGEVTHLRISFGNPRPGGRIGIQAFFTQFDSRHNINSQSYITGCTDYFWWTRDLNFLRENINRMRIALRHMMEEHSALEEHVVVTPWVGHSGRPTLLWEGNRKGVVFGDGVGNNYWDLLPFGHADCYATLRYYGSLQRMQRLEREIIDNPQWNIPRGALAFDPAELGKHADEVKSEGNRRFWNEETGRFVPGVDREGDVHDYGYTFLNLEAIHYGFATEEHARQILSWITGERIVEGDTSQGEDIYHWRFGPRSTTRRNISYYGWYWWGADSIPWGGQVQDGGAVLGFTYHDLMSRLRYLGPDNAWERLQEIVEWFDEVVEAGGYRAYYADKEGANLQGGGTAGGLGMDSEFYESVLVTQVMLEGFLGFSPTGDGFRLDPQLPADWPELKINRVRLHDDILTIIARPRELVVVREEGESDRSFVHLPQGEWEASFRNRAGKESSGSVRRRERDGAWEVHWGDSAAVRFRAQN